MPADPGPSMAGGEWLAVAPAPGPDASDAAQLARSRLDPEAFTGIYDRYFPVIHRYVAGRLGYQAADDLAAEAFLVAFRDLLLDPNTYQVVGRRTVSAGHYTKAELVTAKAKHLKLPAAGTVTWEIIRDTTLVSGPGQD